MTSEDLARIVAILNSKELNDARHEYPKLTSMRDAVLRTCVNYRNQDEKKILLVNYQPSHPQAAEHYPEVLRQLLATISTLRPKSNYERKYGLGEPGIP
ncbi:MAG: hypothetical protein DMF69_24690 [Acidobacteria bacterium]|nr:MAG: hypothetical protein DMF69_24690 [Acidobacteriota bacterium]